MYFPYFHIYSPQSIQRWIITEWSWNFLETSYQNVHMSGFAQPRQKFARKGENCNFEIAVIFYPVKKTF